jgi:uncharacterized membrane-anchored protein
MTKEALQSSTGMLNKVPAVTVEFWLIKLLAVTVGETAADYMNLDLGLGLSNTSWILTAVLIAALMLQFAQRKYVPWIYWVAVVLISVVGTLVTDNLVGNFGVSLETTTVAFSLALAVTFTVWYAGSGPYPSIRSTRPGARPFTGSPSCSHSRWGQLPET